MHNMCQRICSLEAGCAWATPGVCDMHRALRICHLNRALRAWKRSIAASKTMSRQAASALLTKERRCKAAAPAAASPSLAGAEAACGRAARVMLVKTQVY